MKRKNLIASEKSNYSSPLISGENFSKMKSVHTYLKAQGVKPDKYDTVITMCPCYSWSSKQKCY
jgi:hypothetical protein